MEHCVCAVMSSPLGSLWVCATAAGVCGLGFGEQPGDADARRMARYGIACPETVLPETGGHPVPETGGHPVPETGSHPVPETGSHPVLEAAVAQLADYFDRRVQAFDVPLDLRGTEFQRAVWAELLTIPYGKTLTYGEVAMEIARPRAFQAVGQANGANPVAIIVPCHRVVGRNGALTGYAAGVDRKAALLQLEQAGLQLRL